MEDWIPWKINWIPWKIDWIPWKIDWIPWKKTGFHGRLDSMEDWIPWKIDWIPWKKTGFHGRLDSMEDRLDSMEDGFNLLEKGRSARMFSVQTSFRHPWLPRSFGGFSPPIPRSSSLRFLIRRHGIQLEFHAQGMQCVRDHAWTVRVHLVVGAEHVLAHGALVGDALAVSLLLVALRQQHDAFARAFSPRPPGPLDGAQWTLLRVEADDQVHFPNVQAFLPDGCGHEDVATAAAKFPNHLWHGHVQKEAMKDRRRSLIS